MRLDAKALGELQDKRHEERKKRLDTAANNYIIALIEETKDDFDLGQFGFEFVRQESLADLAI